MQDHELNSPRDHPFDHFSDKNENPDSLYRSNSLYEKEIEEQSSPVLKKNTSLSVVNNNK